MRNLLFSSALLVALLLSGCRQNVTFIVASDLHFNGTPEKAAIFDTVTQMMNNSVKFISDSSGIKIKKPFGVFLTGDITESGTAEQWEQYKSAFGLNGEGPLKYPVYETFGNHDGNSDGVVRTDIRERNKLRKGVTMLSENGLHYAIRKNGYLFIVLGSYPADVWDPTCEWCHYFKETFREPEGSLTFLENVLKENKEGKNLPVFLLFHYGWDGFSKLWWTEGEQTRFHNALEGTRVETIFHGHDHAVEAYKWEGIDVVSSGSPQHGLKTGEFLIVEAGKKGRKIYVANKSGVRILN